MLNEIIDIIVRAIKTFSQTLLSILILQAGNGEIPLVGIEEINWVSALSLATVSFIISILMSISLYEPRIDNVKPKRAKTGEDK